MVTLDEARRITDAIEGWLQPQEGPRLFELAKATQGRGVVVEIGSWKGKSTTWLALGLRAGGRARKIYAVDPHTGSTEHTAGGNRVWTFDEFQANVQKSGVADLVEPIVKPSVDAAKGFAEPVELLWIDGAHEYEAVLADIAAWTPKLVEGGVVAFHDSKGEGVRRAIEQTIYQGDHWVDIQRVESVTWARKAPRIGAAQRARNVAAMVARRAYDGAYARRDRIPAPLRKAGKAALRAVDRSADR